MSYGGPPVRRVPVAKGAHLHHVSVGLVVSPNATEARSRGDSSGSYNTRNVGVVPHVEPLRNGQLGVLSGQMCRS